MQFQSISKAICEMTDWHNYFDINTLLNYINHHILRRFYLNTRTHIHTHSCTHLHLTLHIHTFMHPLTPHITHTYSYAGVGKSSLLLRFADNLFSGKSVCMCVCLKRKNCFSSNKSHETTWQLFLKNIPLSLILP